MPNADILYSIFLYNKPVNITVTNNTRIPIKQIEKPNITAKKIPLSFSTIYHIPQLKHNLLSIKTLYNNNHISVYFNSFSIYIKNKTTEKIFLQNTNNNTLYPIYPKLLS